MAAAAMMIKAKCHPIRKHYAKGLCKTCWRTKYNKKKWKQHKKSEQVRYQKWYTDNKEHNRRKSKKRYRENKSKIQKQNKKYYAKNRNVRSAYIKSWYDTTYDTRVANRFDIDFKYSELLQAQNGLCAICQQTCSTGKRLAVDHCHETNMIRGLLCSKCNRGLGYFKDSLELIERAYEYLKNFYKIGNDDDYE